MLLLTRLMRSAPVLRTDHTYANLSPPPPEFPFAFCALLHGISC